MKLCDVEVTTVSLVTPVSNFSGMRVYVPWLIMWMVLLCRYECRKFPKSLDCCRDNHAKECGYWCSKEWKALLGWFGWFRKGACFVKDATVCSWSDIHSIHHIGWQNRCIRPNFGGSQKDQQVIDSIGYGHQCLDGWKSKYESAWSFYLITHHSSFSFFIAVESYSLQVSSTNTLYVNIMHVW